MYKNHEGYACPVEGQVLANIRREEKQRLREQRHKAKRRYMPRVYICSPFAGDTAGNTEKARRYCAFAANAGYIPYAPHLFFPQFMSDDIPDQRELGLFMGQVFLDGCREIWVFGDRVSAGMEREIARAKKRNIKIRYFTEECKEVEP